jgi:DNA repair exonuclease SbcCD ATPase subunit
VEEVRTGESSVVTVGDVPGQGDAGTDAARPDLPSQDRTTSDELDQLRADVARLTAENDRYREHAERTSKLYLAATNYAEWIRENARRDAELALRKARARAEQLEAAARGLEQVERERGRLQAELARLQAMIDETRARLSAFLAAGLEALTSEGATEKSTAQPALDDLRDALHSQLSPASAPVAEPVQVGGDQSASGSA